jgi:hypothetical protein
MIGKLYKYQRGKEIRSARWMAHTQADAYAMTADLVCRLMQS